MGKNSMNVTEGLNEYVCYTLTSIQESDVALRKAQIAPTCDKFYHKTDALDKAIEELRELLGVTVNIQAVDAPTIKDHARNMQRAIRLGMHLIGEMLSENSTANVGPVNRVIHEMRTRLWNDIIAPNTTVEGYLTMMNDVVHNWHELTRYIYDHHECDVDAMIKIAPRITILECRIQNLYAVGVKHNADARLYDDQYCNVCSFSAIKAMCDDLELVMGCLRNHNNKNEVWYDAIL